MPKFSQAERTVLIEIAETFARTTEDEKIRARLNSSIRKLRQSDAHHAQREVEQRRAGYAVRKP